MMRSPLVGGNSLNGSPAQLRALGVQKRKCRRSGWDGGEHVSDHVVGVIVKKPDPLAILLRSSLERLVRGLKALRGNNLGGLGRFRLERNKRRAISFTASRLRPVQTRTSKQA